MRRVQISLGSSWQRKGEFMMKPLLLPASLLAFAPAVAQQPVAAADVVPEMAGAVAAAALPPMVPDPRLAPAESHHGPLPPGWSEAPPPAPSPAAKAWAQQYSGWQRASVRPPLPMVPPPAAVPVPVIIVPGYTGWGGPGYWGWGGGWGGRRGWGCRSSGAGALIGSVAGASIGYGLASPWDRSSAVIVGGLIGALAGSAIERSGRC
jgi:hypothetical protein